MGILTRFKDIMSANVNALLDKAEDPAKMIDQTLLNLRKDLAEVKKETAAVMADEKNAKRKETVPHLFCETVLNLFVTPAAWGRLSLIQPLSLLRRQLPL